MKYFAPLLISALLYSGMISAQNTGRTDSLKLHTDSVIRELTEKYDKMVRDSVEKKVKDSLRWAKLKAEYTYPLIKNSEWSMVIPVNNIQEKPDPAMRYKLLFNMTVWSKDTASIRQINGGLAEIGRIINLHVASGIPKENLDIAIVIHGAALNVYLSTEFYRKKFKVENPNLDILKQFTALKAKFMACGQAERYFGFDPGEMIPEVRTALTAQVVLSSYQLKGYVLYNVSNE
jgi:hypothetical protein